MKDALVQRGLIQNAVNHLRKPHRLGSCYRIFEGKKPDVNSIAYTEGRACRLIVVLKGRGRFLAIEGGEESTIEIGRGDSIFLCPNTWISCIPEATYKSLGIIFGRSFLRLTITQRTVKSGEVDLEYLAKWQVDRAITFQKSNLLQLAQQAIPKSMDERYLRYVLEIVLNLVWESFSEHESPPPAQGQSLWHAICEYIKEHWSEPSLSREQLADHFHVHPNHISRVFKTYGKTKYITFLNEVRLSRSLEFLESSSYTITDIAALCGYTDLQYFIRCFRERYGITPGEFKKSRCRA
jgi:AraC-like DNA-binding protein